MFHPDWDNVHPNWDDAHPNWDNFGHIRQSRARSRYDLVTISLRSRFNLRADFFLSRTSSRGACTESKSVLRFYLSLPQSPRNISHDLARCARDGCRESLRPGQIHPSVRQTTRGGSQGSTQRPKCVTKRQTVAVVAYTAAAAHRSKMHRRATGVPHASASSTQSRRTVPSRADCAA